MYHLRDQSDELTGTPSCFFADEEDNIDNSQHKRRIMTKKIGGKR